jgi:hypothetical protein
MKKGEKELEVPFWILDGFVGILALMIYNFCFYFLDTIGIKGIISKIQDTMGYFCLNSFIDLGFTVSQMAIGILTVFILSFCLGILTGSMVRKRKKRL